MSQTFTTKRCLNCYYFRFNGLERWCAHPDHHRRIKKPLAGCPDWIWTEDKKTGRMLKIAMEQSIKAKSDPHRETYAITNDGKAIKCLICGMKSYNKDDISMRYCGSCKRFYDDNYY